MDNATNKKCSECGASFTCEYALGKEHCWCSTNFPAVMPMKNVERDCLCPTCLSKKVKERLSQGHPAAGGA